MSINQWFIKIIKVSALTITGILASSTVLASLLLFTHTGNQGIIKLAKQFESRLSIELIEGSIFNAPVYQNIAWLDGETAVTISNLDYQFDWSCLTSSLCLNKLNIDGASITLPELSESSEPEIVEETAVTDIDIPLEIIIDSINLNNINFVMGELAVTLDSISLNANAFHKDVSLASQISGLLITLPDAEQVVTQVKNQPQATEKQQLSLSVQSLPALLNAQMLPRINLPINLKVEPIQIKKVKILQNSETLFELNNLATAFTFQQTQLDISQFELDLPETTLTLDANIDFIDDYPLRLNIEGKILKIKQLEPQNLLSGVNFNFESKGSLSDLNSKLLLSKKINLQLQTKLNLLADNLPHNISLDWKSLQWPLSGKAQYKSQKGHFKSRGSLVDHRIDFNSDYALADLPSGKVSLKTQGDLQKLHVKTLKIETLAGELDFSGLLTWQDKIDWLGQLVIKNIDLQALETEYDGQLSGIIKQQASVTLFENSNPEWQFKLPELAITGKLLSRPLSILGTLSGDHKKGIFIEQLAINNADNSFLVDGFLAEQSDLTINLNIVDISQAVLGASGEIIGNIRLKGPQQALEIDTDLNLSELSYQVYQLQKANIKSAITLTDKPQLSLALTANNITIDKQVIDNIELNIGNESVGKDVFRHDIDLLVNSEIVSTDLSIYLTQTATEILTNIDQAKIFLPHQTLTLSTPFDVVSQKKVFNISPHCWQATASSVNESDKHNAGKLCIKALNVGESGQVIFDIDQYLLTNINPFLPTEFNLAGALSADADLKWFKDKPAKFMINITSDDMLMKISRDAKVQGFNDYSMQSFDITARSLGEKVDLQANIYAQDLLEISMKGQLSPYKKQPSIDSLININVPDFSLFLPLIPKLEDLQGNLSSKLSVKGSLKKPTVNGDINIKDGIISSTDLPVRINQFTTNISIEDTIAKLVGSFHSADSNTLGEKTADIPLLTDTINLFDKSVNKVRGKIIQETTQPVSNHPKSELPIGMAYMKGRLDWTDDISGDIHFYANKLEVYDYGKIDLFISPDIHLKVNKQITIKGDLFIDKGKVVVKDLPAGAISQSKDVIVVDVKKENVATELPIIIDLDVDMGNDFQLVALGLDTLIHGKLLIRKKLDKDLSVNGELSFNKGSYRALGQQLVLQKSTVMFHGVPDSPYLKIEAIRDPSKIEDGVTAGVRVTGTPDQLELVIFSEPAMAQQEALSYLTRGQSLNSSSGSNSTMANMLIDIAAGQTGGLMSSIGEGVGIKDLSLSSSGTGDEQSVGVRGEIAPGVELSYGVGVFDSFSIFAIRYEMFQRFYIEASSGIDQAVDAYYEWDWD